MHIPIHVVWHTADRLSFLIIFALSCIGLLFIFSTTYTPQQPYSLFFKKQLCGVIVGITIYILCMITDYRTLSRLGYLGFFASLVLLLYALAKGTVGMGAQRWINAFFFKIQPSELVKVSLPTFIGYYTNSYYPIVLQTFSDYSLILCFLVISFVLILKQPDLGTSLIVLFSGLCMCWLGGLARKYFIYSALVIACIAPFLWNYVLKPYQKKRILVFAGYGSTHKERYQLEQAMIAIGSGGIWGKGILNGTQNTLRFLPESRTDFIFAVLCEEWGLVGALFVLLLYCILFIKSLFFISIHPSRSVQLAGLGLLIHIIFSVVINVGMVLGLLPIVGQPLPLMSYGLANLLITYASLGIIQNITIQQQLCW